MLRLHTFGGLWMDASDPGSQLGVGPRRRLALLATLAAGGPRGVSRDRLLLLLWPDSTEANARHALSQLLYTLRRDAGADVATGATELRLDPGLISSDIADFDAALAAGRPDEAAALYRGPFLDGFYLENGEEFERWAAEMRADVGRRAVGAITQAIRLAEQRGDRTGRVELTRRLTQLEPLSAPHALGYMQALADAGDRSSAIKFARDYETIVRGELKTPAEPSIRALAQRLAAGLHEPPPMAASSEPVADAPLAEPATAAPATVAPATVAPSAPVRPGNLRRPVVRALRWVLLAAAVVAAVAWGLLRPRAPQLANDIVAVASFENRSGDPALDVVGEMAADWISHGISETQVARVVDPNSALVARAAPLPEREATRDAVRARAFGEGLGAGTVVWGSFYRKGDSLTFIVRLSSTADGEVLAAIDPVSGATQNPLAAITAVRQLVLGALLARSNRGKGDLPPLGRPPAYDAYVAFLQGLEFVTSYDTDRAIERFQQASVLDTTFFAPRLWMVATYESAERMRAADSVLDLLEPHRNGFTRYEKAFFDDYRATLSGDPGAALAISREMSRMSPGPLSFLLLGQDALAVNRPREALAAFARINVGQSFLRKWDAYWSWALQGHHVLGENREALLMAEEGRRALPDAPSPLLAEAKVLAALGRVDEARVAIERARAQPESEFAPYLSFYVAVCRELSARGDSAAAAAVGAAGSALPVPDSLTPYQRNARSGCLACAGRWGELRTMAQRLHAADPADWHWLAVAGIAAAHLADRSEAERVDRLLAAIADRYSFGRPDFYRARIAAALGQSDRAVGLLRQAFARGLSYLDAIEDHSLEFRSLAPRRDYQELMQPRG